MWTLVVAATVALVGIWLVNDAWFALVWRALAGRADGALRRRKAELLGPLTGRVVEIGAGLGSTIQYYGAGVTELTLVEPNTAMHAALRAAAGTSRHAPHTTIVAGGGEALDAVATSSADAVVSILTLCSVADLARVIAEAHRVLKPGGRFVFIEHVRAASAYTALLQRAVDATALYALLAGGCHLHRDTVGAIASGAGRWARLDARSAAAFTEFPLPLAWGVAVK